MKIGLMNGLSLGQTPNTAFANFVNLIDLFHQVNSWRLYWHFDAAIQPLRMALAWSHCCPTHR
jgi:uncharacterized membrane protein